jgi:hypothetical protein
VYIVNAKLVLSVPVRTGIASRTAAPNEIGVSLCHATDNGYQSTTARLDSSAKAVNAPQEPTISRGWKDRLVRAITIKVIRATTQAGGAVRLCARCVAYSACHAVTGQRSNWVGYGEGRTRIDVEVRQVQDFEAVPARGLWGWQWVGLWFGKPTCKVQGRCRRERTRVRNKGMAYQLEAKRDRPGASVQMSHAWF